MDIEDIEEIVGVERIIVNPGKESEVVTWDKGFVIITAVQGNGLLRKVDDEIGGRPLNCDAIVKVAFSNDNRFKLAVPKNKKESLVVIVFKMLSTKHA